MTTESNIHTNRTDCASSWHERIHAIARDGMNKPDRLDFVNRLLGAAGVTDPVVHEMAALAVVEVGTTNANAGDSEDWLLAFAHRATFREASGAAGKLKLTSPQRTAYRTTTPALSTLATLQEAEETRHKLIAAAYKKPVRRVYQVDYEPGYTRSSALGDEVPDETFSGFHDELRHSDFPVRVQIIAGFDAEHAASALRTIADSLESQWKDHGIAIIECDRDDLPF